ncbi:MAG: YtxH domain-containing protein [Flavobacterium sp.]
MENSKTVICAFFAGAAIGAALGVLYAPEKGEDLRGKIADLKSDYLGTLKDKVSEFTGKISGNTDSDSGIPNPNQPV